MKESFHERLRIFIEMPESGRLEIKKTRKTNHSKLYIFQQCFETARARVYRAFGIPSPAKA